MRKDGSGGANTTITAALGALDKNLAGDTCVVIHDTGPYSEQITVEGFASGSGYRLTIMAAPTFTSSAPVVTPPEFSTAAFILLNDSVTVQGINIVSTNTVTYGVFSSSAFVYLSSVNVISNGNITGGAGIYISSSSSVSNSSITVTGAYGIQLDGSNSRIAFSTMTNSDGVKASLYISGSDSNTVTGAYMSNDSGRVLFIREGSDNNRVESSSMTGQTTNPVLYINDSDSNTVTGSYIGNSFGYGLVIETLAEFNTVEYSTVAGSSVYALALVASSSNTFSHLKMDNTAGPGIFLNHCGKFTISDSTVTAKTASGSAFTLNGSSNTAATGSFFDNSTLGMGVYIYGGSNGNSISYSTVAGGIATEGGLAIKGSSATTLSWSYVKNISGTGAYLGEGAAYNHISSSTIEGLDYYSAVSLNGAVSNEITRSRISSPLNYALALGNAVDNNISYSTITSGGGGYAAVFASVSDSNTFTASYLSAPAGYGVYLVSGSDNNSIVSSVLEAGGGRATIFLQNSASNTVTGSYLSNLDTYAADINSGSGNTRLSFSTITAAGDDGAMRIYSSSYTVLDGLYVQGSTAVFVNKSTNTIIGGSVFVATNTAGYALRLAGRSVALSLSSSTLTGGAQGAGLYLDAYDSGAVNVSSNTIGGGQYAVKIVTPSAGASLIITSNTILPSISSSYDTYALYLEGLVSGATVYNNGIYYRTPGDAAGRTVYGLYGQSVTGLNFNHNRINNPGMFTAGAFVPVYFSASDQVSFKFNDVNSTGTASLTVLELHGTSITVTNNIFLASNTTGGYWLYSDLLDLDIISDYNDLAGVNSSMQWHYNALDFASLALFNVASGQDPNSIQTNPLLYDVSAGVEDFHPRSAQGRWQGGAWVNDAETSPTVNTGDPAEPYTNETMPNGLRVNLGSYGNTAQASRADPPGAACGAGIIVGCSEQCDVNQSAGPFQTIQHALDSMDHNLLDDSCVVIHDAVTYSEHVTVEGFNNTGYRVKIMALPTFTSSAPVISPPAGSTAAFRVLNDSVTLQGLNISPTDTVTYGIFASSAFAHISSVNVNSGGKIGVAGVQVSSGSLVEYSTITVQAAHALRVDGSGSTVSFSSMTNNGRGTYALYMYGADHNMVAGSYMRNNDGYSAYLGQGADNNEISYSTITGGHPDYPPLYLFYSDSNTITGSSISSSGHAVFLEYSRYNHINYSTIAGNSDGYTAIYATGADSNTITGSFISNPMGIGLRFDSGSDMNAVSYSTITGNDENGALFVQYSGSNTVTNSYIANALGSGALIQYSDRNIISFSTMTGGTEGLYIYRGSSNAMYGSYMRGPTAGGTFYVSTAVAAGGCEFASNYATGSGLWLAGGNLNPSLATSTFRGGSLGEGIYLDLNNAGVIQLSSNIISGGSFGLKIATQATGATLSISSLTFSALTPGATAINFLGGRFVSTFTFVEFNSPGIAVNVNGSALQAGSDIRMLNHAGLRSASLYENDPLGYVNWQLPENCGYGIGVSKDGTSNFLTIQEAVDAAPAGLSTNTCVVVRDAQTYSEQVTVGDFNTNGYRFTIMADPTLGSSPVVNPPELSTAAFLLLNASVTVQGINIVSTNSVTYGIKASSANVVISSVNIDSGGKIVEAALLLSGWSLVEYSSITAGTAGGLRLASAGFNEIRRSTITSDSGTYNTVYVTNSSTNTIEDSYIMNVSGYGMVFGAGADYNEVSRSTIASLGAGVYAINLTNASSNIFTDDHISNQAGYGVSFYSGSNFNEINYSTITSNGPNLVALYLSGASSNTVTGSFISHHSGRGVFIGAGSNYNTIRQSTVTSGTDGFPALYITGALSNTVLDAYVQGSTAVIVNGSTGTVIGGSVLVSTWAYGTGLAMTGAGQALSLSTSAVSGGTQGAAVYLARDNSGVITLSSNVINGGQYGLNIASQTPGAVLAITSITFSALSPGATAINFLDGTFVATITAAGFRASGITVNVNASALAGGSSLTMDLPGGPRAGMLFENDPAGYVTWPPFAPGCGAGLNIAKDGSGHYTGIMNALAVMPVNLSTDTCVIIRDTETYSEQVTVQGFNNNGYRLIIMADPTFTSSAPVVNPPVASTAAFQLMNDSVTVQGINIISTNTVTYGILSSLAEVRISSVNVDSGNKITGAGISLSSYSLVEYSSITVQAAHGLLLTGSGNTVSFSTMTNSQANRYALYLLGADSNTITGSYIFNPLHRAVYFYAGADYNTVSYSTITGQSSWASLELYASSFNTITNSYLFNSAGYTAYIGYYSGHNTISSSTIVSTNAGNTALSIGRASFNTVTNSFIHNPNGTGAYLSDNAAHNTISYSTITGNGAGKSGLYILGSSSNNVSGSYVQGSTAAHINASTGTVLGGNVFVATNTAGYGLRLANGSVNLRLTTSTFAGGVLGAGIFLDAGNKGLLAISSNIITGGQYGLNVAAQGAGAELSVASITFASLSAGATAINFTDGLLVSTFTLVAFNSDGIAVNINAASLQEGSSVYIRLPSGQKAGQALVNDAQHRVRWPWPETAYVNAVSSYSLALAFGENGADLYVVEAALTSDFAGAASSASAQGLSSPVLAPGGLLADTTYYLRSGAKWDQSVYTNPALIIATATLAEPPANPLVPVVYLSSAGVTWDLVTSQGYLLEASTAADLTGIVRSSSSSGLQVSGLPVENLLSNTTYYFRAASLNWNGLPSYAAAVSSATLSDPVTGADVAGVFSSSVAVSWTPLPAAPPALSSEACEGYVLEASTAPDFSGEIFATSTADSLASSLALTGMESDIMYYFRAGALNWNGLPNYALAGSTITPDITPPGISTGAAAYQSGVPNGILVAWTAPGDNGYTGPLAAGSQFRVQWSTSAPETVAWSTTAAQVVIDTGPVAQGVVVSTAILGPETGKTAYFRVWAADEKGQWSVMSATASVFVSPFSLEMLDGASADVGAQTSIAADLYGNLHVSYGDMTSHVLKYAVWNGAWNKAPIASEGESEWHSSLALDGAGLPHVSYLKGSPYNDLGYIHWNGVEWSSAAVDSSATTGYDTSIKVDGLGNPHISYTSFSTAKARYAVWNGLSWSTEDVASVGNADYSSTSLELAADGSPRIVYNNASSDTMYYASKAGGAWAFTTVDSVKDGDRNISLILDSSANAHIAYISPAGVLRYARLVLGVWVTGDIDAGISALQPAIALDGDGRPHVSYYDWTNKALKYARFNGVAWSTYTVDSYGDAGANGSIALDGTGNVHIVYRAADAGDLMAAHWTGAGLAAPLGGNARGRVQAPDNMATGLLGSTSIQWHWTDNSGNEEGYAVYYSTTGAAPYLFGSSVAALAPLGQEGAWFQTGLTPNTSYFAYAAAYGAGGLVLSSAAQVYTLAEAPQSLAASGIYASSFTYSWDGGANPGWTNYQAQLSTVADFSGAIPGSGTNAEFVTVEGLTGNTSYYLRVIAFNNANIQAVSTASVSMLTKPALPSPEGFSNVLYSSFTVSWSTSANSPATLYYAQAGTDPGFSVGTYVTTPASSHTFTGLAANTTYFVRLKAIGYQGDETAYVLFGSTITTAVTPSTTVPCAVSSVAVAGYWSYNGNSYGTRYLAQVSTNNFSTVLASSETLGDHAHFTSGIVPNTTHYLRVASLNSSGALSLFTALPDALTLAAPPLKQADTFPLVGSFAVTLQWLGNANPPQTEYAAEVSTAADFSVSTTVAPGWSASVSASAAGLDPLTVYYFRARARNAAGIVTAYENLGSTMTLFGVDTSSPVIANGQSGDAVWRSSNTKTYNVDLSDSGGSFLDRLEIRASSGPGGTGAQAFDWSGAVTGINANSYTADWGLTSTQWGLLAPGTNYISVRAYDNNGNYSEALGAFYILKDTSPPVITDNQAGETAWRGSDPGAVYLVDFADGVSGLAAVEYSASDTAGSANGNVLGWTALPGLTPGATYYNGPWAVAFGALFSGVTNYISVRARDMTGTLAQKTDAFNVLKNTGGPAVTITSPYAGHYSSFTTITGSAVQVLGYAITGTELTLQDRANYNYWNGSGWGASQVWLKAAGTASWSYDVSGVLWASCTSYQVVARSSDTALNYSAPYATATFTFDTSLPVAFISTPAADGVLETPALVSGTAQDPSPNSGVPYISLTLRRASDLKWWNFFTGAWVDAAISTVTAGGNSWSYYPDGALKGNLLNGASYYIYAVAKDGALPANESPAGLYATTFTVTDTVAPGAVTSVSGAANRLPGKLDLSWIAAGDDGTSAVLASGFYAVACSTDPGAVLSTQTLQVYFSTGNVAPGSSQAYTVEDLTAGVTYYLKIWARDEAENWSAPSALVTAMSGRRIADAISGNVRTALRAGITGVLVEAINRDLAVVQSAYTADDGSGSFTLGGLAVGFYRVQATWLDNGFASSVSIDLIPAGYSEVDFELSVLYELASIGGELPAYRESSASSFRGRSSAPQVRLYQRGRLVATATVGAGGRFLIKNLLPGDYTLDVPDTGGGRRQLAVALKPGENLRVSSLGEILRADKIYAYPNPAGRNVTFHLESDYTQLVKQIVVFDVTGREIKEFRDADFTVVPGGWETTWNIPPGVASGVYMYAVRVKSDADGVKKKTVKKFAIVR